MFKKPLLFTTMIVLSATVWAFGGGSSNHAQQYYDTGVDAIGVHRNTTGEQGEIDFDDTCSTEEHKEYNAQGICTCMDGYERDDKVCIPACPENATRNPETKECVCNEETCDAGCEAAGGTCECGICKCAGDGVYYTINQQCESADSICDLDFMDGSYYTNDVCVYDYYVCGCPVGSYGGEIFFKKTYYYEGSCHACPKGQCLKNGSCETGSCEKTKYKMGKKAAAWDEIAAASNNYCPEGYKWAEFSDLQNDGMETDASPLQQTEDICSDCTGPMWLATERFGSCCAYGISAFGGSVYVDPNRSSNFYYPLCIQKEL